MHKEILVIDDNADIRFLICNILKEQNFNVRSAANYDQAVFEINNKLPDLAVVDIKLDKTGGLTEALKLQANAELKGLQTMIGCMSATSLGIAPAFLIAPRAKIVDLDAPLYLFKDRPFPIKYEGSRVYASTPKLWG